MSEPFPAIQLAETWCHARGIDLIRHPKLGSGTDGSVWRTSANTAIKVFGAERNFSDELECYRRFETRGITLVNQLAVPQLEGSDERLIIIEMTIVEPPYLLDFGKVYLDRPPPYWDNEEVMAGWMDECRELFGPDFRALLSILARLRAFGIWYVDPKPANIRFR